MAILPLHELMTITAFADPASGKRGSQAVKRTRARSSIIVLGLDPLFRVFVLHSWGARCSTTQFIDEIYRVEEQWHPKPFGIEANALQTLFVDCMTYIASKYRGRIVPIVPVYQDTHLEKDYRIRTGVQPVIEQGRLFVRQEMSELRSQIRTFPRSPIVDDIDALNSALSLLPKRSKGRQRRSELDDLAAYLRQEGRSPEYIKQRIREEEMREGNSLGALTGHG